MYRLIAGEDLFKNPRDVYKFRYMGIPSPPSVAIDDWANFVARLIIADPNRRLGVAAALGNTWFSGTNENRRVISSGPDLRPYQ